MAVRWSYLPKLTPWLLRFLRSGRPERIAPIADALHALYSSTIELYQTLLQGTGQDSLVRPCHYIFLYREAEKANLESLEWRLRRERGAKLELISTGDLLDLEPDLSPDFKKAILIHEQARTTNPARLGRVLAEKFQKQGGTFLRSDVLALRPDSVGGVTLVTKEGELHAPKLVLAAGPGRHGCWSLWGSRCRWRPSAAIT